MNLSVMIRHAHVKVFSVLFCNRKRRVRKKVVKIKINELSFLLISLLCLCWHVTTAGNDGYCEGNL